MEKVNFKSQFLVHLSTAAVPKNSNRSWVNIQSAHWVNIRSASTALLLIGFAGAFRRSELIAINCTDLSFVEQGLVIHIRRSKTDQTGEGRKVAIPYARGRHCPVLALKHWLSTAGISDGPIFRAITRHGHVQPSALSTEAVALIVKKRAQAIGLDPSQFSGHSLRAGLATSAAQAGVSAHKIQQQTGHKSIEMLSRYIRDANIFVDNAGSIL